MGLDRWSANGPRQQMADVPFEDGVGLEPDGVPIPLGFEQLVQFGECKRRVTSEVKYSPKTGRVAKVDSSRTGDERDSPTTTTFFNPIQGQGGYRGD